MYILTKRYITTHSKIFWNYRSWNWSLLQSFVPQIFDAALQKFSILSIVFYTWPILHPISIVNIIIFVACWNLFTLTFSWSVNATSFSSNSFSLASLEHDWWVEVALLGKPKWVFFILSMGEVIWILTGVTGAVWVAPLFSWIIEAFWASPSPFY